MSDVEITVVADAEEAARLVAERLATQAREGGSVVLTGGSTPLQSGSSSAASSYARCGVLPPVSTMLPPARAARDSRSATSRAAASASTATTISMSLTTR